MTFIDKRKFAIMAPVKIAKIFIIYIAILLLTLKIQVHPFYQA